MITELPVNTVSAMDADSLSSPTRNAIIVELISSEEGFASLGPEWGALVENTHASVYQTFEWQWLWWLHLGKAADQELHILAFRSGAALVGIAPLFLSALHFAGSTIHRRLRFLGSGDGFGNSGGLYQDDGPSDYLDLIVLPGFEQAVGDAFVDYFLGHPDSFDALEGVNLPQNGIMMNAVLPALRARGTRHSLSRGEVCSRIPLPSSIEEYLRSLSSSVRRRLSQSRKALLGGQNLTVESIESPAALETAYEKLIKLHQDRWMKLGYPGLFSDPRVMEFQRAVARMFLENGKLWFKTVQSNGECIAARLGFKVNGCIYDYLTGFDHLSPSAKHRPGLGLLLSMIEDAIILHYGSVDLLRGNEDYKVDLTSALDHNWNLIVPARRRVSGVSNVLYAMYRGASVPGYLFAKEVSLLRVQFHQHSVFTCIPFYVRFRFERLVHRIRYRNI